MRQHLNRSINYEILPPTNMGYDEGGYSKDVERFAFTKERIQLWQDYGNGELVKANFTVVGRRDDSKSLGLGILPEITLINFTKIVRELPGDPPSQIACDPFSDLEINPQTKKIEAKCERECENLLRLQELWLPTSHMWSEGFEGINYAGFGNGGEGVMYYIKCDDQISEQIESILEYLEPIKLVLQILESHNMTSSEKKDIYELVDDMFKRSNEKVVLDKGSYLYRQLSLEPEILSHQYNLHGADRPGVGLAVGAVGLILGVIGVVATAGGALAVGVGYTGVALGTGALAIPGTQAVNVLKFEKALMDFVKKIELLGGRMGPGRGGADLFSHYRDIELALEPPPPPSPPTSPVASPPTSPVASPGRGPPGGRVPIGRGPPGRGPPGRGRALGGGKTKNKRNKTRRNKTRRNKTRKNKTRRN